MSSPSTPTQSDAENAFQAWAHKYQISCLREGWSIFDTGEPCQFMIQRVDDHKRLSNESGITIPFLSSDVEALERVADGQEEHHSAAIEFLRAFCPGGFSALQLVLDGRKSTERLYYEQDYSEKGRGQYRLALRNHSSHETKWIEDGMYFPSKASAIQFGISALKRTAEPVSAFYDRLSPIRRL